MCGIAGIVGAGNHEAASQDIKRMLDVQKHRGPNDWGIENWEGALLGHRRLSIFDLSQAGHQPMLSDDGENGVVFNGAIYNFPALRSELKAKGHVFNSQTDTEVLLKGYDEWGIDKLVEKLDGMFAFGLWDDRRKTLFLVRDRLGVKPLCFSMSFGVISFASTVRALKSASGAELDEQGVAEYLEFGFLTDECSIYRGIEKVKPGEIVEWHDGTLERRTYWDLPMYPSEHGISFEQAVEETERLLLLAVEKRLQADVPIGALLSGGIDSSLVCWAVGKLGGDLTAYTVGTSKDAFDETAVAARTAKDFGLDHQILDLSDEEPPVGDLVEAFAEPFACSSALGMLAISRKVKESATVLLTGDGGDDVFLGYPEHKHYMMSGMVARKTPEFATPLWLKTRHLIPAVGAAKRAVSFLDYSFGGMGGVSSARDGLPFYQKNNLLGERLKSVALPHREMKWSVESGRNLLAEFLQYDRRTRFAGEYLPKVDGATMFHGLEARSPFLDAKLWEFAASLPFSIRLHKGKPKAILREIARRRIGPSLASGKKQGFVIPVQKWVTSRWRNAVTETLRDSLLEKEGWMDVSAVLNILDKSPDSSWSPRQLWFTFVLESWLRREKN